MFWRRVSLSMLCLLAFAIPFEHKYDKLFRFFSLKIIPPDIVLPAFFDKKIYFYPSDIIAFALLFIALFALRVPMRRFFCSRGAVFLWIVFLFMFISLILSPFSHYATLYIRLLQVATPFFLFCFLANGYAGEDRIKISMLLFGCIVLAAVIQSGIAIAQYAIQGPLGLRLLGEQNHFGAFCVSSGRKWLFDFQGTGKLVTLIRSSGTLPHANVLGGFLCISILAAYSFFFSKRFRFLSIFIVPVQYFAMCLTFSRSALFGWILGTLIWFSFHIKKWGIRTTASDSAIRFLICTLCVSCLFSFTVLYEQISERGGIVNYNALAQGSDALRIAYQKVALQMLKEHPLQGSGFQQLSIRGASYIDDPANQAGAAHNIYLYMAAENGPLCLLAFLCFIASLFFAALRTPYSPLFASLISMMTAFLFIGCCDFYPLLFQQGKLPFFLTAALLAANASYKKDPRFVVAA